MAVNVQVQCPSTAPKNTTVTATVTVTNIDVVSGQYFRTEIWQQSTLIFTRSEVIGLGISKVYTASFTMPNNNVTVLGWVDRLVDPGTDTWDYAGSASALITLASGAVTLTIPNPTVESGKPLSFSFSGFQPNSRVHIAVSGGSSATDVTANSSGAGTGSLTIYETAGGYNLFASDAYGHSAYALFTVTAQSGNWLPALYSLVNSSQLTGSIPQVAGWIPVLYSIVNSAQLVSSIPQVAGWLPALYAIVNSGQLTYTNPQVAGWIPVLYSLVSSGQLSFTPAQTEGWIPALTAIVNSAPIIVTVPPTEGWYPALFALVNANLPLPKPPGEKGLSSWVLPVAIVGGAAVVGTVAALSQKDKIKSAVTKKKTK